MTPNIHVTQKIQSRQKYSIKMEIYWESKNKCTCGGYNASFQSKQVNHKRSRVIGSKPDLYVSEKIHNFSLISPLQHFWIYYLEQIPVSEFYEKIS